jgi:hypothetical protein
LTTTGTFPTERRSDQHTKDYRFPNAVGNHSCLSWYVAYPYCVRLCKKARSQDANNRLRFHAQALNIESIPTKPFEGQKTGTSGLRKKTEVFTQDKYLANWCVTQSGITKG